jgi:hypothetical protein
VDYATVAEMIERPEDGAAVAQLCVDLLEEVIDGRRPVLAVRHPLGFVCLPVIRSGEAGICVHLWGEDFSQAHPTTSQIHSHGWDLVSYVLYGQIGNVLLSIEDNAREATHRIFEIYSQGGVDEVRATARLVRCREERREVIAPGNTYRLAAGGFHESFIVGSGAATLALGWTRPAVDLSLGSTRTGSHRVSRQLCTPDETLRAARMVIGKLQLQERGPGDSESSGGPL